MTALKTLHFCLEDGLRDSAQAGQHNFIGKVAAVARNAGFDVQYAPIGPVPGGDYSLTHMKPPPNRRGLVFRRVYHYPFWQIDQTSERWEWDVAKATFDAEAVPEKEARRFYGFWQNRLFGTAAQGILRDGFVYVPLQGRLLEHRSFQSCSPLEMIEACLEHEPKRRIVATLHPKETYSDAEISALERLEQKHDRLTVQTGGMEALLHGCDYVVTQNSGAAFAGYFFGKPAILFGRIDFHHIALNAHGADLPTLFHAAPGHAPDYARYLWWFWQDRSINAGRPEAEARIAARLAQLGWPME